MPPRSSEPQRDQESKRAVVFGGAGFIGGHLVARLCADRFDVCVADIKQPQSLPARAHFEFCDVRKPISISHKAPFDLVVNLAAIHRTPGHAPHEYYETNVGGALNIVDWLKDEQVVVFTSSISVYGPSEELKTEASLPAPTSDYDSKLFAERIFDRWLEQDVQRRLVVARPAVVFGPNEGGNYTRLAAALRRRTFAYPGRTDVIKSGGYVTDLVNALMFAAGHEEQRLLFNFCYPDRATIGEICQAFADVAGYRLPRCLPPWTVSSVLRVLRFLNPRDLGPVSAERVAKLTASTNVASDELVRLGFSWETDLSSALKDWAEVSAGRFV